MFNTFKKGLHAINSAIGNFKQLAVGFMSDGRKLLALVASDFGRPLGSKLWHQTGT